MKSWLKGIFEFDQPYKLIESKMQVTEDFKQ